MNGYPIINGKKSLNDLFQVILSNGFPQLRICTAVGVESLDLNETWTKSPSLRLLYVEKQEPLVGEHLRSVCPNLRPLKNHSGSISLSNYDFQCKRIYNELNKIKNWESEKKFILEYGSIFGKQKSVQNLNNAGIIRGRILPEKDPYCFASFLIEIKFPSEYPFKMPEIRFLDPIYHINIMNNGKLCCCWGREYDTYLPTTSLVDFIKSLIETVNRPDLNRCTDSERATEYQNNYEAFYEKALRCTLNTGRPRY